MTGFWRRVGSERLTYAPTRGVVIGGVDRLVGEADTDGEQRRAPRLADCGEISMEGQLAGDGFP